VLPGQLRSHGRRQLKNVRDPVELFSLVTESDELRLPIDPVCRMAVDPASAPERDMHRGVEYHFCSSPCAQAFRVAPERYLEHQPPPGAR
jgi:adenylate cyclase